MVRQTQDEMLLCSNALFVDLPRFRFGALFCRRRHSREGQRLRDNFVSVGITNSIIRQHDSISPVIFG